jgi:hypothetical protein
MKNLTLLALTVANHLSRASYFSFPTQLARQHLAFSCISASRFLSSFLTVQGHHHLTVASSRFTHWISGDPILSHYDASYLTVIKPKADGCFGSDPAEPGLSSRYCHY